MPVAHRRDRRKVRGHRRLLRKAEEYTLPIDGVREEEPFRHDRLVRNALGAVVHGGLENVEVPQPDGLLLARTRGVEIPNDDLVLAELVVESPVAEECERVRRTPNLLAGLLGAEDPIVAPLDGPEAVNEIA